MAQIQIQKVVKKQELGKKSGEGLEGYTDILDDIKSLLEKAKYRAYKAVDNLRVQTYCRSVRKLSGESCSIEKGQIMVSGLSGGWQAIWILQSETYITQ